MRPTVAERVLGARGLSAWDTPEASRPQRRDVYAPVPVTEDPLGPWKTLNAMLAENPPPAQHAVLLEQFSGLGVGPGLDVESQPPSVRLGLARAAVAGMTLLKEQFASGDWATIESHVEAIGARRPDLLPLYRALADAEAVLLGARAR